MSNRRTVRLVPLSLRVRELREAGAVTKWLDHELAKLDVGDQPALVTAAYTMARLAENPQHPELHEQALAELRNVLDSLWSDDDEMIERAIRDLRSLVHGGDRLTVLRELGVDGELIAEIQAEARGMLAYLLDDDDPEPRLAAVKP